METAIKLCLLMCIFPGNIYTMTNNASHSAVNQTEVKDFENCGLDYICQSELIMSARFLLQGGREYVLTSEDFEEFHMEVNVTNKGEPAFEARVFIVLPLSVRYIDFIDKTRSHICRMHNEAMVYCELGNPFEYNKPVTFRLRFEFYDGTNQLEDEFQFFVFVNSTSGELSNQTSAHLTAFNRNQALIKISGVHYTVTAVYSGEVKDESAMKTFDDVGNLVKHEYYVQQQGPVRFADLEVAILWPWQVANDQPKGKWLLYLEDVEIIEGRDQDHCYVDPANGINFLNLTELTAEARPSRNSSNNQVQDNSNLGNVPTRRRSTNYVVPADTFTGNDGTKKKLVTMDCTTNSAKCVTIYCKFPKFPRRERSKIIIKSRLWNSTLIEDYSEIDWVRIVTYADLKITNPTIKQLERSEPGLLIETNVYPDRRHGL